MTESTVDLWWLDINYDNGWDEDAEVLQTRVSCRPKNVYIARNAKLKEEDESTTLKWSSTWVEGHVHQY